MMALINLQVRNNLSCLQKLMKRAVIRLDFFLEKRGYALEFRFIRVLSLVSRSIEEDFGNSVVKLSMRSASSYLRVKQMCIFFLQ